MIPQTTIKHEIHASGVGVHTGKLIKITLTPAPANTGIVFRRADLRQSEAIVACADNVGDTRLSTTLQNHHASIATVEHLLAAAAGLCIDNMFVNVYGPELPIMDGSAAPFVFLLESAGVEAQNQPKRFVRIKQSIYLEEDDKWAKLEPYDGFKVKFEISFNHPLFKGQLQTASFDFSRLAFIKQVSRARTFGFLSQYEMLKSQNLALGGSLNNAVVLDDDGVMNEGGLRFTNELVMHKILDAIGDLYLLGSNMIGSFHGHKSGHALNNKLLRKLLEDKTAWEYVHFDQVESVPEAYTHLLPAAA